MEFTEPGTIDDLVEDATAAGYRATSRLVHDWVSKGLLGKPQRRRTGPNGSEKALHSANQRFLFIALLRERVSTPRLSDLASVPLSLWLYGGDEWVSTDQALRAFQTWVGDPRRTKAWARKVAAWVMSDVDDPRLGTRPSRRELLDALAEALYTGYFDRDLIVAKARPLFETADALLPLANPEDPDQPPRTPEALAFHLEMIIAGGQAISAGELEPWELDAIRELENDSEGATPTPEQFASAPTNLFRGIGVWVIMRRFKQPPNRPDGP
ncbi:hypothetical protein Spla01_04748 [Streptomyces platensis]|uniref:Uncharacterized protein n=1 Tax=Streptomyces platensis TaxID=58346 RepID=A0ABX3XV16_STRPT|nr:hypothetical protein [Streptomyces platensis]OSY44482.1 hypothetical protein BG653_04085 [Streptomyces platensis]